MVDREEQNLRKIAYFFVDEDPYHPPDKFSYVPDPKSNITNKVYWRARDLLTNLNFFRTLGRFEDAPYGPHIEMLARNATLIRRVDQNPEMKDVEIYARFFSVAGFDMDSIKETAKKLGLPLKNLVEN